ncbi:MAG: FHA domain-containing protein [Rhodothermales bacterium]|nr:FHA domain-containing protein [Rhodothermales bacterium]
MRTSMGQSFAALPDLPGMNEDPLPPATAQPAALPDLPGMNEDPMPPATAQPAALPDLPGMNEDTMPPATAQPAAIPFVLELGLGDGKESRLTLNPGKYVLGRGQACNIVVADSFVSTRHAELIVTDSSVEIIDLKSSNHTYVDDVQISQPTRLTVGARLRFGPKATAVLR